MVKIDIFKAVDVPKMAYFDLPCYRTWMGKDGIVRTVVKEGSEIVLKDAKLNSEVVNSFPDPGPYPIIVDTRLIRSITKEARDYLSIRGRSSKVNVIAIIRKNALSNMIANFFIGLNKPAVPVRLFNSETEALKWCQKYVYKKNG